MAVNRLTATAQETLFLELRRPEVTWEAADQRQRRLARDRARRYRRRRGAYAYAVAAAEDRA